MLVLALDSASPRVSIALGDLRDGRVVAARDEVVERSSTRLLQLIREVLEEAGIKPGDLEGLLALSGPGSFTGLRIGLATTFGLHQALRIPAVALPTLRVLAAALTPGPSPKGRGEQNKNVPGLFSPLPLGEGPGVRALGAVDALRGEWTVQPFRTGPAPVELGPSETLSPDALAPFAPAVVIGFGISAVASRPDWPAGLTAVQPGPLAPVALRLAHAEPPVWDPLALTRPLYARPPAATLPKPRLGLLAAAVGIND
ncbi:MAG TPA: tRNA (adenosine(37)-N6)-threonylcarbamoyltransferase complex dimerization subunit type 1 TsaB [Thermoanaerobaculia bacterium]|jgi:tRNA threonylcarbamoyl adenosine modification protein YeaZ|nr:tRNA (adenosine(37)-N6)-threonylcarbamoyltransferase complex dimerization subunit type 1 TsaB [Thermoanaerobaculia bacterium]